MVFLSSPLARATIFTLISAAAVFAQATGSLSGVVFDPLGEPLPGGDVQVSVSAGNIFRATTSNKGTFSVASLPAGTYQVAVFVHGSRSFVTEEVAVSAGKTVKLEFV